jgi:hypothetical protein
MPLERNPNRMEPTRPQHATLVDLLDRVLDKGLVIQADLVVCVAGIPLIGVNLRAALAGMQTMLDYGLLQGWDERTRAFGAAGAARREPRLMPGEKIIVRVFGARWYSKGIYRAWQPGHLYLTDRRIMLFRSEPGEIIFEVPLERLESAGISRSADSAGGETDLLHLRFAGGQSAILYAQNTSVFLDAVAEQMSLLGRALGREAEMPAAR